MSTENTDTESGSEVINPTVIAQIASRLFNEFPEAGRVPKNDGEILNIPSDLQHGSDGRAAVFQQNSTDLPEPQLFRQEWPFERLLPDNSETDESRVNPDYYFLSGVQNKKQEPLGDHADNLVDQQTYSGNRDGSYGLKKPGYGLPGIDLIDFSFLFGDKDQFPQPLLNEPNVRPENPYQSYYFIKEPSSIITKPGIFDVAAIRRDFPVLNQKIHGKPLIWFDNAATTQKPRSVINAVANFYATDNSNIHRAAHTLAARSTDAYENAREKIRKFIGAGSSSEIIFVRGTTEGINLVAQTWGRKFILPGDEIVLTMLEHHANIVPWQMLAKEKGAIIRVAPINDRGEIMLEEYARLLGPRTKLVSLTQASNSLGTVLPVKEMIQMAKRFNARILVDGAQSVAHLPANVQELDADFFVFSGHKIFSPNGIGAVYGKRELLEIMPPWQGGGNMIKDVTFEETSYNEPPARFEAGTPNVADAIGLGAALDYVSGIGLENIARYEHFLTEYGMQQLSTIPDLRLIGTSKNKVGILSFVLKNIPNEEVGKLLDQEGIAVRAGHHCSQPSLRRFGLESTVRPSLAFYNTKEEIDCLVLAIRKIQRR